MSATRLHKRQATLFVDFWIRPEAIEVFKAAHRPVWAACAKEPECILFDVFHDPLDPGHFRFIEVWNADREWFETKQLTKPYYDELWPKTQATWAKDAQLTYLERVGEGCTYKSAYLEGGTSSD